MSLSVVKSLEEINEAFTGEIPLESLVELVLERGLELEIDHERKDIRIVRSPKVFFGMKNHLIAGYLKEYSSWGASDDASLEFETEDGYSFSLTCSQIRDYYLRK